MISGVMREWKDVLIANESQMICKELVPGTTEDIRRVQSIIITENKSAE